MLGGAPGTVTGWGANASGQTSAPLSLAGVTAIAAGWSFSLALTADGAITGWGDNTSGQTSIPLSLAGVTAIAAGVGHSLALKTDGTVAAWGLNNQHQTDVPSGLSGVTAIAAGGWHSLALKADGTVTAWGDNGNGQTTIPSGLSGVTAIAAGLDFSLALRSDGTVMAWGGNSQGQLNVPTGLSGVTAIAAGHYHGLALKSDMTVVAWGRNSEGEANVPGTLSGVTAIAAGQWHSLALKWDGTVVGWGYNVDGETTIPADLKGVTSIAAGAYHSLAVVTQYQTSTYHATAPARVLDTRTSGAYWTNIGLTGPFVAGTVRTFSVAGATYVGGGSAVAVPANATAVTGNLTVVDETASGVVALGPTMTATGEVTTINFVKGDVRANNVTVGLAADGTLSAVYRAAAGASIHLILDVTGYFDTNLTGATYHTVAPGRILDTRPTSMGWTNIGLTGKFRSKVVRTFTVAGASGLGWASPQVPVGATAVTGNVTVTNATYNGFLSLGPTLASVPKTSTVNIKKGNNCANGVTVALNGNNLQAVWVGGIGSTADVIFDVTGYFTADLTGFWYTPITPVRLLDSSTGKGLPGNFTTGTPRTLVVGGMGVIPSAAAGISGNLTLVNPSANGWAQVAPAISGIPTSSTVNAVAHQTVANGFDVALDGSGQVMLVWVGASGSAHLQLDVTGYWK